MTDQQTSAAPTRRSHDPEVRPIMRFSSGTLHENWYIAARSKDVGNKRPLASTIMEEKVALWRTGRGRKSLPSDGTNEHKPSEP
jgi:phenylpropionate dioxygenase-like ring-hydroxylating dioxygenase large terminal subunit